MVHGINGHDRPVVAVLLIVSFFARCPRGRAGRHRRRPGRAAGVVRHVRPRHSRAGRCTGCSRSGCSPAGRRSPGRGPVGPPVSRPRSGRRPPTEFLDNVPRDAEAADVDACSSAAGCGPFCRCSPRSRCSGRWLDVGVELRPFGVHGHRDGHVDDGGVPVPAGTTTAPARAGCPSRR
jgi:hypothetical protein